jgi:DNA-binding NarL/FixJ family response regulator
MNTVGAPAGRPTRVLIVEDHRLLAELLCERLDGLDDFEVVGQATTGREALELLARVRPDLVVIDHNLPDRTGTDVIRAARESGEDVPMVVLTGDPSEEIMAEALAVGAAGHMSKDEIVTRLVETLRRVRDGENVFPRAALNALRERHAREAAPVLSERELEVLRLLADGADSKTIARRLSVSYHTARDHCQRINEKLGVRSRLEAVARAREQHLI